MSTSQASTAAKPSVDPWADKWNFGRWFGYVSATGEWFRFAGTGTTMSPLIIDGVLHKYANRDNKIYVVRYQLEPITPAAHDGRCTHYWLTELSAERYDGVL
ncbi:hypothetical protein [Leifsonia sp. Leaf264]|uniref:hypothetical protein n=1 Tax=Leifsonia sp. Leaf264 TaxID=1736314 RepID=UPI0012FB56D7|nr:hypothetical protein [Leifsonia sp. Leaf264]